ncbi:MAG: response regulator [Clostridia bacterium]
MEIKKMLVTQESFELTTEAIENLNENKIKVLVCPRNGKELLKQIAEQKPDFVVLDLLLYELDALEVVAKVKASGLNPLPKFILASAVESDVLFKKAKSFGVNDYLIKPFTIDSLLDTVIEKVSA